MALIHNAWTWNSIKHAKRVCFQADLMGPSTWAQNPLDGDQKRLFIICAASLANGFFHIRISSTPKLAKKGHFLAIFDIF